MMYSIMMMIYSTIPFIISIFMMFNNWFLSIEMSLINMFSFNIPISFMMDWISCMFLSTVMFISSIIIMFSMFYIPKMEMKQFSLMLLMFVMSMSLLILSDNIIFILLGWDGLGMTSYILVIYYQNFSSAASGSITLLSNRIGDIMILLSISILMMNLNWNFSMNEEFNKISLILLMIAAFSKSAQFPFSAWLPAAMAAPTPISALVHSSTLVTAGVFLMIRIMNNLHPTMFMLILIFSSMTTLYASMAANWEMDLKKIIALSTLSQIAMMMFAISMKSTTLAFFHLITHALFKSTMFLCAGIMINNSSYQDMRMMGMNMINSPLTLSIMGISNMALMGLPFMSGFFSKDSIIELMLSSNMKSFISIMMIFSIGLTISYSMRMINFSKKLITKSKSDNIYNLNKFALFSILIISPMSILSGTLIMWMINPMQIFILPLFMKMSIPMVILLGLLIGLSLQFKNKTFLSMGESSIYLWFIHIMSLYPFLISKNFMNTMNLNDKSWQEFYGPFNVYTISKNYSSMTNFTMNSFLFSMIIIMMIPILWM